MLPPPLKKWQRNQIIKAIQSSGLDPLEFNFEGLIRGVTRIQHKWSESYFLFEFETVLYVGHYKIGDGPDLPCEGSWETLMTRFSAWLDEVKRDLDTPDLWVELQAQAELLGGASDQANANTPFTPEEQNEIETRLRGMEQTLKVTYSLSAEQIRVLDVKINYLIEAAGRLGRTDWRGVYVSIILSFILASTLPPETVQKFLVPALQAIGHLFGPSLSGFLLDGL